jgi:hypothetical protein
VTADRRPGSLRAGLRRLATGLIAYGAVGLLIALVAAIALVWAGTRLTSLGSRVETQVVEVVGTLERTSTALRDAGTTATSFAVTLERTPPVVRQTAQTIADLRADLRALESQFAQVQILGGRPFATVAEGFGRMATNLDGLDERLELIAADLESNRTALLANASSLSALGDRLGTVAEDLESSAVAQGLGDLGASLTVLCLVMLVWIAIPAVGALWLGWWLRSEVGAEDDDGEESPTEPAATP